MTSDFRAPGWLARHQAVGWLMFIIGILAFSFMAFQLKTNGPLVGLDMSTERTYQALAAHSTPGFDEIMTFGFFLGKEMTEVIGAILVVYFLYKRFWPEVFMVLIGWSGGAAIWFILTRYFDRVRPEPQMGIVVHEPSFPSGHTMQAVLCFGMLAYFIIPKMPNLFWKWVIAIAAIATMLFVGYSRLFESGHYLSDLLAGYALGIAWAGLVYTVLETFTLRRRA